MKWNYVIVLINGIEWKFVIDKIMYYTEETIHNFFRKMVSITWDKNGGKGEFNESIKSIKK